MERINCLVFLFGMGLMSCDQLMHDPVKENPPVCSNSTLGNNERTGNLAGKHLFERNCAACHNLLKDAAGPATADALQRWNYDRTRLKQFIRNAPAFMKKDNHGKDLYEKWKPEIMPPFYELNDAQIDSIIDFGCSTVR